MKLPLRGIAIILLGGGFVIAGLSQASAGLYLKRYKRQNANGYVIAESWHGNGKIRGAVRATRRGPQVKLPGGAWIYCESSCTHTLRTNSIDFWENMGKENDGVGYLRFD